MRPNDHLAVTRDTQEHTENGYGLVVGRLERILQNWKIFIAGVVLRARADPTGRVPRPRQPFLRPGTFLTLLQALFACCS